MELIRFTFSIFGYYSLFQEIVSCLALPSICLLWHFILSVRFIFDIRYIFYSAPVAVAVAVAVAAKTIAGRYEKVVGSIEWVCVVFLLVVNNDEDRDDDENLETTCV